MVDWEVRGVVGCEVSGVRLEVEGWWNENEKEDVTRSQFSSQSI